MIVNRQHDLEAAKQRIKSFPVTAVLGPRQCGKTFLAKQIKPDHYFDLENPRDLNAFANPQLLLENLKGLIVIDEIQRRPEFFPVLRYLVDYNPHQKYLILGSASGELLRQSSESLAGRISYYYLGGFHCHDVGGKNIHRLWLRGGFPKAFLAKSFIESQQWMENYLTTFLEKDIPQLGITIPSHTLRRFWLMLSHYHGQILNFSEIASSFGISDMTVRKYIEILEATFIVRVMQPWHVNVGKRLVKRPKIFFKDSGVFHQLLLIHGEKDIVTHPKLGASWEGFALEAVIDSLGLRPQEAFFWRTHAGAEVDLFWQAKGKAWGAEIKYGDAPQLTKSMQSALEDLQLAHLWVIYPGEKLYSLTPKITVVPLRSIDVSSEKTLRFHTFFRNS